MPGTGYTLSESLLESAKGGSNVCYVVEILVCVTIYVTVHAKTNHKSAIFFLIRADFVLPIFNLFLL